MAKQKPWEKFQALDTGEAKPWERYGATTSQEGDLGRLSVPDPAASVVRGATDVSDAYRQFVSQLEKKVTSISPLAGPDVEARAAGAADYVNRQIAESEQAYQQSRGALAGKPDAGRLAGNVAVTLPLAGVGAGAATTGGRLAAGALAGAGGAALSQPVQPGTKEYWREKGIQTLIGGAFGLGLTGAAGAAGRLISPKSSPDVQALLREGVAPTPGQTLGGVARNVEEKAKSLPLVGDAIRSAERRALLTANRASVNRALEDANLKLPADIEPGAMAIGWAEDALTGAYDDALARTQVTVDRQFLQDYAAVRQKAAKKLPEPMQQVFQNIIESVRLPSTSGRVWPGQDVKTILSDLGREATLLKGAGLVTERQLGRIVEELKDAVKNAARRSSSPDASARIDQLDKSWTKFVRVQSAAGMKGATDQVFTGSQLLSAVRGQDKSVRKGRFARRRATEQEFAQSMQNVLGNKVPDSGTAGRALLPALAGVGGAGGALAPVETLTALGLAGVASTPYLTGVGQRGMARLLAGRQGVGYKGLARLVKGTGRAAAPAAGVASNDPQELIDYLRGN